MAAEIDENYEFFEGDSTLMPTFGSEAAAVAMPQNALNDQPINPAVAYEIVHEYLSIEGNAAQNLATFCQTYMDPFAERLMTENLEKNAIDKDEYPMTADLENRCVAMLGNLWHADPAEEPMGTSTVGSSEACILGGLSMLSRWKKQAEAAGVDVVGRRPNLVISSGYQVCWEKFCSYWGVEMRTVPLEKDQLSLNMNTVMDYVNEDTIGIVAILGITYTGKYDDVETLDALVERYNAAHPQRTIRIHVDGASGAMVAPFITPNLTWDFSLKNVWSINTSGHKYGLVYPGIGWALWRSKEALPEDLIFWVSYLGGEEASMAVNFSRSAAHIVGQYFMFMRNGFAGYKAIHERTLKVARYVASEIKSMGMFTMLEEAENIPIVCWTLAEDAQREWTLYDLSDRLRMNGWLVPAYPMPENMEDMTVQRIVARQDFSMQFALILIEELKTAITFLDNSRILPNREEKVSSPANDHSGRSARHQH